MTMTMEGKADCCDNKLEEGASNSSSCGKRVVNSAEPHVTFHDGSMYTGNVYKASDFQPQSYNTEGSSPNRSVFPATYGSTSAPKVISSSATYTAGGQSASYFPTTTGNTTYSPPSLYSASAPTYFPSSVPQLSSRTTPQVPTYNAKYPTSFPAYDAPTTQTQSYTLPTQGQSYYTLPTQGQSYTLPTQVQSYTLPTQGQSYTLPTQSYTTQTQSYTMPTQTYAMPTQSYTMPTQAYMPAQAYAMPSQNYTMPTQSYALPTQSYTLPTESYTLPKFGEECGFPANYPAVGGYPSTMQAYNPNNSPFSQEELANYYHSYINAAPQETMVDHVRAHSHTVHDVPAPMPMPMKTSPTKKMPPAKYPLRKKKGCCGC